MRIIKSNRLPWQSCSVGILREIFEVPRQEHQDEEFHSVVIVRKGEKLAGLVVDSFIGQQEIVLKSLGNYLTNIFAISEQQS